MSACIAAKRVVSIEKPADSLAMDYLTAMARAVTGVSVVATDGAHGRTALTVSAVTSVSADPPLLLVCINRCNPLRTAILNNTAFSVNLLASDQTTIADTFAGRIEGARFDFGVAQWRTGDTGVPLINGAAANFECVLEATHESGTHTIVIGRVLSATATQAEPLLYTMRAYGQPGPLDSER